MLDFRTVTFRDPDAGVLFGYVVHIDGVLVRSNSEVLPIRAVLELSEWLISILSEVDCIERISGEDDDSTTCKTNGNLGAVRMISHRTRLSTETS